MCNDMFNGITFVDSFEFYFLSFVCLGESYETDKIVSVSKLNYERCNIPVSGLYIRFMAINTTLVSTKYKT